MYARRRSLIGLILAILVLSAASPALAKKKKGRGSTAPGQYTDWSGEVDRLEIVKTFQHSAYGKVVVKKFDSSKTPLPEKDDNTYEPVQEVLGDPESSFVEGLRKAGFSADVGGGGAGTLVVHTVVEEMDPGSRAARYWGGFGAGAVRVVLRIEVKDGGSGATLLKMHQERRSGFGVGGGSYVNLLNRTLRQIGGDLGMVLNAF